MVYAIIPAAGAGTRMGAGMRKQYMLLARKPVLTRTVAIFTEHPAVDGVVVAAPPGEEEYVAALLQQNECGSRVRVVAGGPDRQASVRAALQAVPEECAVVLVHDAVRPLVSAEVVAAVLAAARAGAVSAAMPVQETVKRCAGDMVVETLDRTQLWAMQTPQGFPRDLLAAAHAQAGEARATDDCALVERMGAPVRVVPGNAENIKITTPADLAIAERLLARRDEAGAFPGVGFGYDVHRLVPGRRLYLGGVEIPHETGLLGHSDADVLLHAIMDALLGAAGLGDIGRHFPDNDPAYGGISSVELLAQVKARLSAAGLRAAGVDATVIAERPRLAPHVPAMQAIIGATLGLATGAINIKATTNERLGFVGREEGIAAEAVARVERL